MAIYHLSIKIISRGKGKSAVAAAAYRAGENILNQYDGIVHDYTRKGGIVHTEILLPANAPDAYLDRTVLWNAVEQVEKAKNAQLAREIEIALPKELAIEQNILLTHEYVKRHFVSAGMCADVCIHDKKDGNPHAHIMLTMRPFELNGEWGAKQKKEYILDENGDKIYDPKRRQYKCTKIETTDWNAPTKAEEWRQGWADICNEALKQNDVTDRLDHRSFERQGIEQVPTIHLGPSASQMEKRGIRTERGNTNRDIAVTNQNLRQLKARIAKLQFWLKEEMQNAEQPDLADVIHEILYRKPKEEASSRSQSIYNLKDAAKVLGFLSVNKIKDFSDLDEIFSSMRKEQSTIRSELVSVERRMVTLKNHLEQTDIYLKYKNQKTLSDSEQILFTASDKYLRSMMNGNTTLPVKKWKAEYYELALQHGKIKQKYLVLKDKVKEAELIRSSVHSIMRQEQREEKQQRMKTMEI